MLKHERRKRPGQEVLGCAIDLGHELTRRLLLARDVLPKRRKNQLLANLPKHFRDRLERAEQLGLGSSSRLTEGFRVCSAATKPVLEKCVAAVRCKPLSGLGMGEAPVRSQPFPDLGASP